MAEKAKKDRNKVEKSSKKDKKPKKTKEQKQEAVAKAFSLLADENAVDATLSSLFAAKPNLATTRPKSAEKISAAELKVESYDPQDEVEGGDLSEDIQETQAADLHDRDHLDNIASIAEAQEDRHERKRKRKRRDADEELEGAYMDRLAREEEKEAKLATAERKKKRQKGSPAPEEAENLAEDVDLESDVEEDEAAEVTKLDGDASDDTLPPPPRHETQEAADVELSKANRTVFLGNVSTTAIESKSARKTLVNHLSSFFTSVTNSKDQTKHKLESIRFRSTPYASAIPKKAAFARKELTDATAKSTNAYAVYSSPLLSREAAKHLNGTVVLDRHLRVDEVAHPAKTDHHRCVFVGNLGFVDDESNIQHANEEEGREVRKRGKEPGDVEEGLWRTFGRCGSVESVRVIRDSTTRVGKGIAYVQFEDANAVEAALLYDAKKFPPMLPRKLRVSRAKAIKRNAKPGSGRPTVGKTNGTGYQRKVTGEEASRMGRVGKLYGRAAAANVKKSDRPGKRGPERSGSNDMPLGERGSGGIRKPEDFVFEGHRASSKSGKPGLKLGGKKKGGKPTSRSAKRGAVFKAGGGKKAR